ncbi:MAG: hypothetical protein ACREIA_07690, partial [Opitutaceae bacterium]
MKAFLEDLPLDRATLEALDSVHADSLFELASAAQAAPREFEHVVGGRETAEHVFSEIFVRLSPDERQALKGPVPRFAMGAIID